jgi:uncharacterized protein DUF5060
VVKSVLLVGIAASTVAGEPTTGIRLSIPAAKVPVFERAEIEVLGVPAAANPFDPEEIAVDLEARPPSGKTIHLPGYFHREYERKLDKNHEVLTPIGEGGWRIRFAPVEPGRHDLEVTVAVKGLIAGKAAGTLEAVPGKRRGFARLEAEGKRYFAFDDGTPLFLNGLCACWHDGRGTYDYDDWLPAYQKAGINYIRLWMCPWAFGIECDKDSLVRYRLDRAWTLDRVLAEADRLGILVMLCFDYHGMFEVKKDFWGSNDNWVKNPYNQANGGPCAEQNDFFTSEPARKTYLKRLRYLVGRYGAFSNVLAWEFFNEIDNVYKYLKHPDVVAWHVDMARRLRSIDPYRHLITSSLTGQSERKELWLLPEMDFAQYHSYNEEHPVRMMARRAASFHEKYGKPFFVSEYGTDFRGWKPETDPHLRALHQAIWSGAFAGSAGTGMTWWWQDIHKASLYQHWSALAGFLKGTAIARQGMGTAKFEPAEGGPVKPFGVAAGREALVWLLDPAFDWPAGAKDDKPAPVTKAQVVLLGLEDGRYGIEWWDTLAGKRIASAESESKAGRLILAPPAFQVDIAGRVKSK